MIEASANGPPRVSPLLRALVDGGFGAVSRNMANLHKRELELQASGRLGTRMEAVGAAGRALVVLTAAVVVAATYLNGSTLGVLLVCGLLVVTLVLMVWYIRLIRKVEQFRTHVITVGGTLSDELSDREAPEPVMAFARLVKQALPDDATLMVERLCYGGLVLGIALRAEYLGDDMYLQFWDHRNQPVWLFWEGRLPLAESTSLAQRLRAQGVEAMDYAAQAGLNEITMRKVRDRNWHLLQRWLLFLAAALSLEHVFPSWWTSVLLALCGTTVLWRTWCWAFWRRWHTWELPERGGLVGELGEMAQAVRVAGMNVSLSVELIRMPGLGTFVNLLATDGDGKVSCANCAWRRLPWYR
jgi:hypothetical protein